MNLYKVRFGEEENVFEYEFLTNSSSLFEINKILKPSTNKTLDHFLTSLNLTHRALTSNDMELIKSCGGTVLFKENDCWIINYLIDLDFEKYDPSADVQLKNDWREKVRGLIESVRRDIKLIKMGI